MVKAACHRILRDAALAEDAAQEVFLLLVRKLPSLPPETILGGFPAEGGGSGMV
jgi:DNA-directed RNA polymerase specialized sigma24 family protein